MAIIKKGHVKQFDAGTFPVNLTITAIGADAAGMVSVDVSGSHGPVDHDIANAPIVVPIGGSKCRVGNSTTNAVNVAASD